VYDAISNSVPGALVNTAPTGGGKTLSWVAPVVDSELDTVAIFPTNALIEDQQRNIVSDLLPKIDGGDEVTVLNVTSETLSSSGKYGLQFPSADSNGERLEQLLRKHLGRRSEGTTILLTNPDTFVLMRRGLYNSRVANIKRFQVAVIDEFHRANRKEKNTMLFLLDEMYDQSEKVCRLKHLIFLSATPDAHLERKFDNSLSAPYYRADDFGWRSDLHTAISVDAPSQVGYVPGELPDNHYAVLPPVNLTLNPAQTFQSSTEMLSDEGFLDKVRDGRTVIMLDGIHEVDQAYNKLIDADVSDVVRVDGFNRENIGEKLQNFGVLVSNSAVEVGVDFDTDQIIFSGHGAASFFQRLGRLRTRETESIAEGYVPPYTFPKLSEYQAETGDEWISRAAFEEQCNDTYIQTDKAPESFDRRYSAVEAYDHAVTRVKQASEDYQERIMREAYERIGRHFFPEETLNRGDIERLHAVKESGLLDNLKTYRGQSIQTVVYDERKKTIQTYNIPYLLRHGNVSFHPREAFLDTIPPEQHTEVKRLEKYSAGYCIYTGSITESNQDEEYPGRLVAYKAVGELYTTLSNQTRDIRTPAAVTGLEVEVDQPIQGLGHLKDALSEQEILCYALEGHVSQIQKMYSLGPFGFIYPLLYPSGDAAIAFGHDALYLHCRVQDQVSRGAEDELDEVLDW
jgi:CRISPR-associated endonuclease/helicase Cas3